MKNRFMISWNAIFLDISDILLQCMYVQFSAMQISFMKVLLLESNGRKNLFQWHINSIIQFNLITQVMILVISFHATLQSVIAKSNET